MWAKVLTSAIMTALGGRGRLPGTLGKGKVVQMKTTRVTTGLHAEVSVWIFHVARYSL